MSRKPVRRVRGAVTKRHPWSPHLATLFRLSGDCRPPSTVDVRYGLRAWTLAARFTQPDGTPVVCRTRLGLGPDGRPDRVVSETMTISMSVRGSAK